MGVGDRPMEDVMERVRNRHYQARPLTFSLTLFFSLIMEICCRGWLQLACTLTFEAIHGSSCDSGVNHPNQYFSLSQKITQSKVSGRSVRSFFLSSDPETRVTLSSGWGIDGVKLPVNSCQLSDPRAQIINHVLFLM